MGEFNSIFYEETIYTNEANSTTPAAESLNQVINRVLDKITKSNREEISLSHRKKLINDMINDIDDLIKDYDKSERVVQSIKDKQDRKKNRIVSVIMGIASGTGIIGGIIIKKSADAIKANSIGKSYEEYRAEYSKSELQYAKKRCKEALDYIEEREEILDSKKKAKARHESFSFIDNIDML